VRSGFWDDGDGALLVAMAGGQKQQGNEEPRVR
jgi:hypothetical protein